MTVKNAILFKVRGDGMRKKKEESLAERVLLALTILSGVNVMICIMVLNMGYDVPWWLMGGPIFFTCQCAFYLGYICYVILRG